MTLELVAPGGGSNFMIDIGYLNSAEWYLDTLADEIHLGQHFELCPGGYIDDATFMSEIYDAGAIAHFLDIRMGVPGVPAKTIASYQPSRLADALDAFFRLKELDRPLYYCGGMMCLSVTSKVELIRKIIAIRYNNDPDAAEDIEDLIARCEGPDECLLDAESFRMMTAVLGPYGGRRPM